MPKRWRIMRSGALGALCGLFYSVYVNYALLPYAFESFDMTAYLTSGFIGSIAVGTVIFAGAAILHNLTVRLRTRRSIR